MKAQLLLMSGAFLALSLQSQAETFARFVPERSDDFAWENDMIAFRAYGPALRDGSENSGIDAWLKRVDYPIINKWYEGSQKGVSYHEDHGEGLDNYHVGSSAGCGGTGIWLDGQRHPLEAYVKYKVHEVTSEQCKFTLTYENRIDRDNYKEEKTITIRNGERLFLAESVFYKNGRIASDLPVCVGLTTHEGKAETFSDLDAGWIATWETLDDSELGTGVVVEPARIAEIIEVISKTPDTSHILAIVYTDKDGRIAYRAGYGWKKAGAITTSDEWQEYLNEL